MSPNHEWLNAPHPFWVGGKTVGRKSMESDGWNADEGLSGWILCCIYIKWKSKTLIKAVEVFCMGIKREVCVFDCRNSSMVH